jgi:hypothetical protein
MNLIGAGSRPLGSDRPSVLRRSSAARARLAARQRVARRGISPGAPPPRVAPATRAAAFSCGTPSSPVASTSHTKGGSHE